MRSISVGKTSRGKRRPQSRARKKQNYTKRDCCSTCNCPHVISGSVPKLVHETCFGHHFCASFQLFCADLHRFLRRPDLPALEPSAQHVVLRQHHPGHRQLQGALPSSGRRFRLSSLLIGRARSFSSLAGQPLQAVPAWHGVCLLGTCRTAHRAACPLPLHTSPWLVLCCAVRGAERCCS